MSTNLAIATALGVSPNTLTRLEEAGIRKTDDQQRFVEIAKFVSEPADALLPYVERGVTLQTLSAASQATKDSGIGEVAPLSDLIHLANLIGDMSGERLVPAGFTIRNGWLMTSAESTRLELEEIQEVAKAGGYTTELDEKASAALPGSQNKPTAPTVATPVAGVESRKLSPGQSFESETGQEKILNGLLETAEEALEGLVLNEQIVNYLNAFIRSAYDDDALLAHIAIGRDEEQFRIDLQSFARGRPGNRIATSHFDDNQDEEDDVIERDPAEDLSLESLAEDENDDETE